MDRKRLILILKYVITLAVLAGVGWQFSKILRNPALNWDAITLRWEYLLPAGLLYLCCHTLWGTFWVQLLWGERLNIPWRQGISAYYVSQFGKYVPGKAWVIVLRMAILHGQAPARVVAVTGVYEALISVAAGSILASILLSHLVVDVIEKQLGSDWGRVIWGVGLVCIAIVPFLILIGAKILSKARGPDARPLTIPKVTLLLQGILQASVGWAILGVSLGLVIRGLSAEPLPWTWQNYWDDLGTVAAAYVAGFVILAVPGGIGAREWVLQQGVATRFAGTLGTTDASGFAVVVALVLRLVWTVFEVALAGALWWKGRYRKMNTNNDSKNLPDPTAPNETVRV